MRPPRRIGLFFLRWWVALAAAALTFACGADVPDGSEAAPPPEAAVEEGWTPLFNGRDLTGWTPKFVGHKAGDNYKNTFRVVDGFLTVSYDDWKASTA